MNVGELKELLEGLDDEVEVRIAHQPSWPFEYSIGRVVEVDLSEDPEDEEDSDDDADGTCTACGRNDCICDENDESEAVVYIAEGAQLGYLPQAAATELGWSGR